MMVNTQKRRRRSALGLALGLLAVLLWCPACQFLQNEFFQLDVARPPAAPEQPFQAW